MSFLNHIHQKKASRSLEARIWNPVFILLFGFGIGILSKYLDCTPSNQLPKILEYLDVRNFLGRFSFWVLMGLWLSVSSPSPGRAASRVFLFFAGMVSGYYLYSKYAAGFFPKSYAAIWFAFALGSPLPAFICWYARGKGIASFILSVMLLGVLFWCSFLCGWGYIEPRSVLELLTFLAGIVVLRRDTVRASVFLAALGIVLGIGMCLVIPFHFG